MNNVDYDKSKFTKDEHGNLLPIVNPDVTSYKGFTIDNGIGNVKVWDKSDNYIGDFPDVKTAKEHIDTK